jgi:hypothetical protein
MEILFTCRVCIRMYIIINYANTFTTTLISEISSTHGGEYDVQNCLLGCTAVYNDCRPTLQRCVLPPSSGMRLTSETSVDNHFTRQYNPEDNSEHHTLISINAEEK